jgi:AraC-like DNA-binding protein
VILDEAFRTSDLDEAESITRRIYPRAQLRESRGTFLHEQVTRGDKGVNFTRFKLASRMDIAVDFDGAAAFGVLLGGDYAAESNGSRVDSAQPFLLTPGPGTSQSEQLDLLTVNIDTDVLAATAARQLGVDRARLRFERHGTVSPAMRAHWLRTVHYAWSSVIQVNEVFRTDAVRAATLEAVVTAALAAFPIEVAGAARASDLSSSSAIRRAKTLIEDNADQPLTVVQIAEAARLSVRALQLGFQRELGTSPMSYLRHVRLEAARAELIAASGDARVADIARRWAFVNLGRFAAHYRTHFGENPTDTLRR